MSTEIRKPWIICSGILGDSSRESRSLIPFIHQVNNTTSLKDPVQDPPFRIEFVVHVDGNTNPLDFCDIEVRHRQIAGGDMEIHIPMAKLPPDEFSCLLDKKIGESIELGIRLAQEEGLDATAFLEMLARHQRHCSSQKDSSRPAISAITTCSTSAQEGN